MTSSRKHLQSGRCSCQTPTDFNSTLTSHMTKGMTMESSTAGNFAKTSQALADKASDKAQAGIRSAQQSAKDAGDSLASKVSEVHDKAVPVIRNAGSRAQST